MDTKYLESARQIMLQYKTLAENAMEQLAPELLFKRPNEVSNSIAMIIQHMHGNMLSRWTDFLTTDGEKEWRQRDAEFEEVIKTKEEVLLQWEEGWACLMNALNELDDTKLADIVLIRNEPHTVTEAINRQIAHYSSHVGQIVFYVKALLGSEFKSLSIPKNQSQQFNKEKFGKG